MFVNQNVDTQSVVKGKQEFLGEIFVKRKREERHVNQRERDGNRESLREQVLLL